MTDDTNDEPYVCDCHEREFDTERGLKTHVAMADRDYNSPPGAKEGNQSAQKHGLYSDRDLMYQNLPVEKQRLVAQMSAELLDKTEGSIGAYEREMIRNVCVDIIKARKYNEHLSTLDFDITEEKEYNHKAYRDILKLSMNILKELGINTDSPEAKEADAKKNWFSEFGDE